MRLLQRTSSLFIALCLGLGLSLSLIGTASAHAKVLNATPGINSTISQAPTTVTVHTAENINPDPKKSNLFVYGPAGDLISQGNAKVSLNNPKEMSIGIKPASNGVYIVRWITVSAADGDPDEGAFVFTVNPNAGKNVTPAPTSTGIPLAVTLGIGVLALLIGLAAGLVVGRRATRTASKPSLATLRQELAEQAEEETPK